MSEYSGYIYGTVIPNDTIFDIKEIEHLSNKINALITNKECLIILNKIFSNISGDNALSIDDVRTYSYIKFINITDSSNKIYLDNTEYSVKDIIDKKDQISINESNILLIHKSINCTLDIR